MPNYGYTLIFYAYMVPLHALFNKQQHTVASLMCDPNVYIRDQADQACIKYDNEFNSGPLLATKELLGLRPRSPFVSNNDPSFTHYQLRITEQESDTLYSPAFKCNKPITNRPIAVKC